ncbi:MAG TPA: response regulator [Pyrinomonadaceae bacterium]|jgi:two-component system response regulator HydG
MQKKILIAEDYADIRLMMKMLVRGYGYEVIEAADGYEAVEKVKQHHPDLILMDLSMPIMNGLTATEIIRTFDGMQTIPIIAVTAYGNSFYSRAMRAGCTEVLSKPLDFETLQPLLSQYLP